MGACYLLSALSIYHKVNDALFFWQSSAMWPSFSTIFPVDYLGWLWQVRKDVEGSLFLVQRNVHPIYQIIILNKKSQRMFYFLFVDVL